MATGKSYYPRPSHRFLGTDPSYYSSTTDSAFEFDESDLYSSDSPRKISTSVRSGTKQSNRPSSCAAVAAKSLPVNVPDWSKILREDRRDNHHRRRIEEDDDTFHQFG
ncbi:unnamed protein product [Eruca vesicaria subsp. sativa]|uniref:Uncharacterized protein n=1 Tax=Eruca vesicaria subsp. sativa TaxID=29727 RepID=A0ABC8IZ26_ERUVS|nr:unnamed protein product [Eruca vesicaria subsp. sativa]